jgi:response regulator RpfG family c-di-GMP phosphodiesterase
MGIIRSERGKHFAPLVLDAFEKVQPEFEEIRVKYLS